MKQLRLWVVLAMSIGVACGGDDGPGPMVDGGVDAPDTSLPPVDIPSPVLVQTMASAEVRAGETITVSCVIVDEDGEIYSSAGRTPRFRVSPEDSVVRVDGTLIAARVGEVEITCTFPDLMVTDESPAIVRILPGAAAEVVTSVDRSRIEAGDSIEVGCIVFDAYGNRVDDATPTVLLAPSAEGNAVDGATASFTRSGIYDVTCDLPGAAATGERVEVTPSLPAEMALARVPDQPVYGIGQVIEVATIVTDRFGNVSTDADVGYVSAPPGSNLGRQRFRYAADGVYTVTATVVPPTEGDVPVTGSVTIIVNGNGPTIQCVGPQDGDMVDAAPGSSVTFQGSVDDESGVASVLVNGRSVTVDAGGAFTSSLPVVFGINFVDVVATDAFGEESSRTCSFLASSRWGSATGTLDSSVSLQLRQPAIDDRDGAGPIDALNDLLHRVVNSPGLRNTLHTSLLASNPLKPSSCDQRVLGVCVLRSEINYLNSEVNGPNVTDLTLINGGLRAHVRLNNVRAQLRVSGTFSSTGWVDFEYIDIALDLNATVSGGRPRMTVRPGTVVANVGSIDTNFSGLSGFIIDIVVSLAEGTVRNLVRDLLRDYISASFNDILDGVLSGLDIDSLGTSFDVPRLDGSGTIPIGFGVGFSSLSTTPARMLFGIGSRFTGPVAVGRPTLGVAIPPGSGSGPLIDDPTSTSTAVSVHLGLFNQVLHTLWRGGLLEADVRADDLGGSLPAGLQAVISGALPPVAAMPTASRVELGIGALTIRLTYPGVFDTPITVVLGAKASTNVRLMGNDLAFDTITVDELFFSTDDVSLDARTRGILEGFFTTLVQSIVDTALNDALPAIPIPSFDLPASLSAYGIPVGTTLGVRSPVLANEPPHFVLRGNFGEL